MDCVFCKIINKEIPSKIVYEDDTVIALLDVNPATRGHTLVIPKVHTDNVLDTDSETFIHLMNVSKMIGGRIKEKLGASGLNILLNTGESAGQSVMHTHVHLIPRYENDGITVTTKNEKYDLDEVLRLFDE